MQLVQEFDAGSIERLTKQGEFLVRTYQAEFSHDPTSQATESARSNLIALQHTAKQMYEKAVAQDMTNIVTP
jgi:hypothetical protein